MVDETDDTVLSPPRTPRSPNEPDSADTIVAPGRSRPRRPVAEPPTDTGTPPDAATPPDAGTPRDRPARRDTADVRAPSRAPARGGGDREAAPTVYALRIAATGQVIALTETCLIGRDPRLPRVVAGRAPRLISVPSPKKEVSSTHLEVRQIGGTVVLTDLRSTNGTIVLVPGNAPRTLRQGETVVVSPGTLVDLGDDVVLQILSARAAGTFTAERMT